MPFENWFLSLFSIFILIYHFSFLFSFYISFFLFLFSNFIQFLVSTFLSSLLALQFLFRSVFSFFFLSLFSFFFLLFLVSWRFSLLPVFLFFFPPFLLAYDRHTEQNQSCSQRLQGLWISRQTFRLMSKLLKTFIRLLSSLTIHNMRIYNH